MYGSIEYLPDCDLTGLEGTVWGVSLPDQLPGILLKVCVEGEFWCATLRTGQNPNEGAGYFSGILGPEGPRAANWWIAIVDAQERALSQAVRFQTNTHYCHAGGIGQQWVIIDFKRNY